MSSYTKSYLEPLKHTTKGRPFHFYTTRQVANLSQMLYVHWHSEIEIIIVESGSFELFVGTKSLVLEANDFAIIPSKQLHYAKGHQNNPCTFHAFLFSIDFLGDMYKYPYLSKYLEPLLDSPSANPIWISFSLIPEKSYQSLTMAAWQLMSYSQRPVEDYELCIQGSLLQLWQALYLQFYDTLKKDWLLPKANPSKNSYEDLHDMTKHLSSHVSKTINELLGYIHSSYSEAITLDDLVSKSNFSKEYFCRCFKYYTGYTPMKYISRYRIMQSCILLTTTNDKIGTIAVNCGFHNISYFNREFQYWMNTTPRQYARGAVK